MQRVETESPALRKQCEDLRAQHEADEQSKRELQYTVTSLTEMVKKLEEAKAELTTELTSRSSDDSKLSASVAKLKSEKLLAETRCKKLQTQLNEKQTIVEELNMQVRLAPDSMVL